MKFKNLSFVGDNAAAKRIEKKKGLYSLQGIAVQYTIVAFLGGEGGGGVGEGLLSMFVAYNGRERHTHTETDRARETDRQTDRQTDSQTDRDRQRQTQREILSVMKLRTPKDLL